MPAIQKTGGGGVSSGSATAVGGGNGDYSTEKNDFTATVTNNTKAIVLSVDSVGGSAITTANFANGTLKVQDVSLTPDQWKTIVLDKFTWTAATKTLDVTSCTGAFTFGTGDIVSLTLTGPDKMRQTSDDSMRNTPTRDVSDQQVGDMFVLTNVPNATPDETIIVDLAGYSGWSVHVEKTGGADTFTVEYAVSNEDALSTADWLAITPTFASGSATADHIAHPASNMLVTKALKLKFTTDGGANDFDAQVFLKRWY